MGYGAGSLESGMQIVFINIEQNLTGGFMSKELRSKIVGVRLTSAQFDRLQRVAQNKSISASTIGRILIEMFLRQEVNV